MSNQKVIEALEHSLNCASEPLLRAQLAAAIRQLRAPTGRLGPRRRSAPTLRGMRSKQKPRRLSRTKV